MTEELSLLAKREPSLREKQHFRDNKVLGFHRFMQILQHSDKRWVKTCWNGNPRPTKTKVQIINKKLHRLKNRRLQKLKETLDSNLTMGERIQLQAEISEASFKIALLKQQREESRLPPLRGDKSQGVYRI